MQGKDEIILRACGGLISLGDPAMVRSVRKIIFAPLQWLARPESFSRSGWNFLAWFLVVTVLAAGVLAIAIGFF